MRSIVFVCATAIALGGCVVSKTAMLDEHTAIISSRGNAFASSADAIQKSLGEAAKTTLSRGYRYFAIAGSQDQTQRGNVVIPGQTTASGSMTFMGNTAMYSGSSYTTPAQSIGFVKPGVDLIIRMYRPGEIDPRTPGVWDAESVLRAQAASS